MNVLAVIHGADVPPGVFRDVMREAGHRLDEWSLAWGTPPARPIDDYGAVLVLGGSRHTDQDDRHAWLREENLFLQRLLDQHVPVLGVCLGAQLLAKACGAPVHPAPEPEIGWIPVELTEAGAADPVLGRLPERFDAFEWHYYTYGVPGGAEELARSESCSQAFRIGEAAWGIQFHAEVTLETVRSWLADETELGTPADREAFAAEMEERIAGWNLLGREICGGFVEAAELAAVAV